MIAIIVYYCVISCQLLVTFLLLFTLVAISVLEASGGDHSGHSAGFCSYPVLLGCRPSLGSIGCIMVRLVPLLSPNWSGCIVVRLAPLFSPNSSGCVLVRLAPLLTPSSFRCILFQSPLTPAYYSELHVSAPFDRMHTVQR